jgi:hypothetical protein
MFDARVMLFATAVVVLGCATDQVIRDAWYGGEVTVIMGGDGARPLCNTTT